MPHAQACDIIIDSKPTFGHCGIVAGTFFGKTSGVPMGSDVIHATSNGVIQGMWGNGRAWCYRANTLTRATAQSIQRVAEEIKGGAEYGCCRAVFKSWSGSSSFGSGALGRLKKYRERMQSDQGVLKNVYCSELVVVAYQLGVDIDRKAAAWIDLDGKHSLPSTLKAYLDRNSARFTCMGIIDDPSMEIKAA